MLESSDQVRATADHDSALTSATAGTVVDIPKDASEGISLSSDNAHMFDIALPNANNTADAQQIAPGTVAYPATNGSANAVQANEDGSVRMLIVIANSRAPSQYDYKVTVPGGGRIELTDSGGAVVVSASGELVAAVDPPWAKDATGKLVETHFTTDGQTLAQHVKHNEQGVSYPVTADPRFSTRTWYGAYITHFSRQETYQLARGATLGSIFAAKWTPIGIAFGLVGWWAQGVYDRGQCVVAHIWSGNPWATWFWSENC